MWDIQFYQQWTQNIKRVRWHYITLNLLDVQYTFIHYIFHCRFFLSLTKWCGSFRRLLIRLLVSTLSRTPRCSICNSVSDKKETNFWWVDIVCRKCKFILHAEKNGKIIKMAATTIIDNTFAHWLIWIEPSFVRNLNGYLTQCTLRMTNDNQTPTASLLMAHVLGCEIFNHKTLVTRAKNYNNVSFCYADLYTFRTFPSRQKKKPTTTRKNMKQMLQILLIKWVSVSFCVLTRQQTPTARRDHVFPHNVHVITHHRIEWLRFVVVVAAAVIMFWPDSNQLSKKSARAHTNTYLNLDWWTIKNDK